MSTETTGDKPSPIQLAPHWLAWRCPITDCAWRYHATSRAHASRLDVAFDAHWADEHDEARQRSLFDDA